MKWTDWMLERALNRPAIMMMTLKIFFVILLNIFKENNVKTKEIKNEIMYK